MARCKGAEASIIWVREAQAGADSCDDDTHHEKLQALAECNYGIPTLTCDDMARFGGSALEAAKNFL